MNRLCANVYAGSVAVQVRIYDQGTAGHVDLLIEEKICIIYELFLLSGDCCVVVIEMHPHFAVLYGMFAFGHTGVVTRLAASAVLH
jgi:hypothetical protein